MEALRKALNGAAELLGLETDAEVSVLLVDDATIRELNSEYRGKDYATDVLSFPLEEETMAGEEPVVIGGPAERMLGDIVISIETAQKQATEYGHSVERELTFLAVHGLLHLLGLDHEQGEEAEKIMRSEEKRIMEALGVGR
jgi:probable rRNA maturation factor